MHLLKSAKTNQKRLYHSSTLCTQWRKERRGEQAAMEPANERQVCATRHAHAMEEEKVSQHTGAVQGVRVQQPKDHWKKKKKPLRAWGGRKGHNQDTLPNLSHPPSLSLSDLLCLPHPVGVIFQLKAEDGVPPLPSNPWGYILIHPWFNLHWSAESRTYHWEQRGRWGEGRRGWGSTLSLCVPRALGNKSRLQWDNNRLFLQRCTDVFRSH